MNKFMKSFKFTYIGKVTSKSFIVITSILIILVVLGFNADKIMGLFDSKEEIGVVTENKAVYSEIKKQKSEFFDKDIIIKRYNKKDAEKKLKNDELEYVLNISTSDKISGELKSKEAPKKEVENNIENLLNILQSKYTLEKSSFTPTQLKALSKTSDLNTNVINDKEKINKKEQDFQLIFTTINLILMVFIVMNYVNQIAMEVAIEKTSRVIEMIITSIKPSIHITAKILGIFSVALTQIVILVVTIFICLQIFNVDAALNQLDLKVTSESTNLILFNIVFWIIGIISYSLIAAILGSLTSRIEDIGQSLMPLLLILLGSFYIVMFSISNPDNKLVTISSYIPLSSPFTMLFRFANNNADVIHVLISIVISILFLIICFFVASRSYKHSVLNYDKNIFTTIKKIVSK